MRNSTYEDFANYYDMLGWNRFSKLCAQRLENFVRLRGKGNETVLDLACGTGELEYRLNRTNLRFTGVDISQKMLKQARRKNKNIKFIHGDITSIRLNKHFDLVVCFFDSVNHLSGITTLYKMFKTARIHLRQNGFFLFDMLSPEGLAGWECIDIRRKPDYTLIVNGFYYPEKMMADITIEGFINARRRGSTDKTMYKRFLQKIYERSYTLDKVAESLTRIGFSKISVSSFDPYEPVKNASRWFFVVS
jgi:SAM-dependent methyltransferase